MPQVDEGVLTLLLRCMQKECLSYIKLAPKTTEIARFFRANERNTKETKYHALFMTVKKRKKHYLIVPWAVFSSPSFVHDIALVAQSCLPFCDPMVCSLPGSWVHGILQARILEWVAMPSSGGSSQPRDCTQVSLIAGRFFTVWATTEACEYWSG